jgi:hypothetical protein
MDAEPGKRAPADAAGGGPITEVMPEVRAAVYDWPDDGRVLGRPPCRVDVVAERCREVPVRVIEPVKLSEESDAVRANASASAAFRCRSWRWNSVGLVCCRIFSTLLHNM